MASIIPSVISEILERDLLKLENEVKSFQDEKNLWKLTGDVKNPAGNLTLHLCGALQHFIGAVLGNSGYIRNRDAEFADKNIPREKLIQEIHKTIAAVKNALATYDGNDLDKEYPIMVLGKTSTKGFFLVHLVSHFSYHLGQINYLRRILEKQPQ